MAKIKVTRKPGIHYLKNTKGQWWVAFHSRNGKEIWRTSETYTRISGAKAAMLSFTKALSKPGSIYVLDNKIN